MAGKNKKKTKARRTTKPRVVHGRRGAHTPAAAPDDGSGKPKVFLGCSGEARPVAEAVAARLSGTVVVYPWWEGESFRPSRSTLDGLIDACRDFHDFGLFLFTPDDKTRKRDKKGYAPRDNVWFEYGLFISALGPKRTFGLEVPQPRKKVLLATDLDGIGIYRLEYADNEIVDGTSVGSAIGRVESEFRRNGRNHGAFKLCNEWGHVDDSLTFALTLDPGLLLQHRERLLEQQLVVAVRREVKGVDPWEDPTVCIGKPRVYDNLPRRSLVLSAEMRPEFLGHVVYGELFVLPPSANVARAKTLSDLLAMDGLRLDSKGQSLANSKSASTEGP